jgi:hypothetical protein
MYSSILGESAFKTCLARLYHLPTEFVCWSDGGRLAGWYMHLDKTMLTHPGRAPGVYSTSFAVQLLCGGESADEEPVRQLIVGGIRYLVEQATASDRVLSGVADNSKQHMKLAEIGHTDFQLSMKCISVLEAANAVAEIRHKHTEFGLVLQESDDVLDKLAAELKRMAIYWTDSNSGMNYMAWPWHALGTEKAWDIIPTVYASLALSHPSLSGSSRYLDTIQPVINCVKGTVNSDATLVHKAIAYRGLIAIGNRIQQQLTVDASHDSFRRELTQAATEIHKYSWQEVLHYQVPSQAESVSHYKPWIWLCPRIELAECLAWVDVQGAQAVALENAAEVISNVNRNGAVRFMYSQPPTLLGNCRSAQFLKTCDERLVRTQQGRIQFSIVRARVFSKRLIERQTWLLPVLAIGLLVSLLSQQGVSLRGIKEVHNTQTLLVEALTLIWSVYPVWIALFVGCLVLVKGSIWSKILTFLKLLGGAIFVGLLLNLLSAKTP